MGNDPQNPQEAAAAAQQNPQEAAAAAQQAAAKAQEAATAAQEAATAAQKAATKAQHTAQQVLLSNQALQAALLQRQSQAPFKSEAKKAVDTYNDIVAGLKFEPPPNSPKLTATAKSSTEITLTWDDDTDNAYGYKIRRQDGNHPFTEITQLGSSARLFTDIKLTSGTTYFYELVAYNVRSEAVPSCASAKTY